MSDLILTPQETEIAKRLLTEYDFFARFCQRIEPKDLEISEDLREAIEAIDEGADTETNLKGTIPFLFHPGQGRLHAAVEEMKARTGRVRKAIVKPRQVGWSTYIHGRGQWLCTRTPGMKVFIVSHNAPSTKKFLRRVKKLCASVPKQFALGKQLDNSNELAFTNGAQYAIATAGSPDAMRSDNAHFAHISEEAYFDESQDLMAAIIPALSDGVGSEWYRETTARGRGTPWHKFILDTQAGGNEWELFFDPWYLHPAYRKTPPDGWKPDEEALEAQRLFNLDIEQLYWRAMKIKTLDRLWLFKQEYPATVDEAFQSPLDTLCNPDAVMRARKNKLTPDEFDPVLMGVDPGRTGDRTCITFRQGNIWHETLTWGGKNGAKLDDMQIVGICAKFLAQGYNGRKVDKMFIDHAIGAGIASRLRELGFVREVVVVHFGEKPEDSRFLNARAEMAVRAANWLGDTGELVQIPDNDDVASDILCIPDFLQTSGSEKIKLVAKEEIKKAFGKSPDIFDSWILTFRHLHVRSQKANDLQSVVMNALGRPDKGELAQITGDFDAAW